MKESTRHYASAANFRTALETRLTRMAKIDGIQGDPQRLRKQVAFDRFLARLFEEQNSPWILKGGYAMELRFRVTRGTKDIDLSLPSEGSRELNMSVLERLQKSTQKDLGDFFVFTIGNTQMELDGPPEGGTRYPVVASLAARMFTKFHIDIGIGDATIEPTEIITGQDWLGFARIQPMKFVAISREQQFAEKLHAYTRPRQGRLNSRVKDLIDMALLVLEEKMDKRRLREAIQITFRTYDTHLAPEQLLEPPMEWIAPYEAMAKECELGWTIIESYRVINNMTEVWTA